jgi:hypothetical protein
MYNQIWLFFCRLLIFLRSVSCKQCWSITQLIISSLSEVKAETAKKLGLEFISITEYGINNIEIPNEYLKLTIQGLRNNLEYASVAAKDV